MSNNRILLIAYKYPPFAGVGCFRWSKLSKNLALLGYEVHVITVGWKDSGVNTFTDDVSSENIHIHKIRSNFFHNLKKEKFTNRFVNFVKNAFVEIFEKLFFWDDEAQHWGKYLIPYATKLVQDENIPAIIATGHPFSSNYWASQIKMSLPELVLIQDFRDPWVQHVLKKYDSERRKGIAKDRMVESIRYADAVVTVTDGLGEIYKESVQNDIDSLPPFFTISNGFDEDDMDFSKVEGSDNPTKKIVLTHGISLLFEILPV